MTKAALFWLMPYVESRSPLLDHNNESITELRLALEDRVQTRNSSKTLKQLRQRQFANFAEYEAQFGLMVLDVDRTESSKVEQFRQGLVPAIAILA